MRFLIALFVVLGLVLAYLAYQNPGTVTVHLSQDKPYEVSIIALALLSMTFGGLVVTFVIGVRGTRNALINWQRSRNRKREEKVLNLFNEGVNAFLTKRHSEALTLFEKILLINPDHVPTLLRLGNLQRVRRNYGEAIRLHRKAKGLDEQNGELLLALARDLEEAKRYEEAVQALRELVRLDDSNLTALLKLRDLLVRLERWEEAHDLQEEILRHMPKESDAQEETALFLGIKYELGREYTEKGATDQARRYFKGAIKLDRNFLPAYIGLSTAQIKEQRIQDACELLEKAYWVTSSVVILHRLEDLYLDLGEPEKILRIYHEALIRDPKNQVLKFYLGKLYYRLEMVDDAFEALSGIDPTDPKFPDLHKILGNLYLRKGDLVSAVEEFKKGLNLKKRVLVPYYCPICDYHTTEWSGRCTRCGRWNTYEASPIMGDQSPSRTYLKPA
jgi:lipopolysaccharide biosynthesis regulator YciM